VWRSCVLAIGFGVGALVGAAIANANSGYYYGPGYYYAPGPYAGPYAYEPEPVYVQPAPHRAALIAAVAAAGSSPTAPAATATTAPATSRGA